MHHATLTLPAESISAIVTKVAADVFNIMMAISVKLGAALSLGVPYRMRLVAAAAKLRLFNIRTALQAASAPPLRFRSSILLRHERWFHASGARNLSLEIHVDSLTLALLWS